MSKPGDFDQFGSVSLRLIRSDSKDSPSDGTGRTSRAAEGTHRPTTSTEPAAVGLNQAFNHGTSQLSNQSSIRVPTQPKENGAVTDWVTVGRIPANMGNKSDLNSEAPGTTAATPVAVSPAATPSTSVTAGGTEGALEMKSKEKRKTKVLVVEDEADIRRILRDLLESQDLTVFDLATGHAILHQIELFQPDVLLVDQMMPGLSGTEIIAQIRKDPKHRDLPIIMVTGLSGEDDKVRALNLGADDYVTKPFLPKELSARISALVRRTASREMAAIDEPNELIRGEVRVDLRGHRAFVHNEEINLTLTEFKILRELLRQVDHVLTREQLRERALESVNVTDRTIDVHMASLRKKMGTAGDMIETVRGVGYRLAR